MKLKLWLCTLLLGMVVPRVSFAATDCNSDPHEGNYGTVLTTFEGVPFYSNGDIKKCTGTGNGCYQCVEVVQRFYRLAVKHPIKQSWVYAKNAYDRGPQDNLKQCPQEGPFPPSAGDIICFGPAPGDDNLGHVGILKEVRANSVIMIDQNRTNDPAKIEMELPLKKTSTGYQIETFAKHYITQGWLHYPGYVPSGAPPPPPTYLAKIMYQSPQSHTLVIRRNQSVSMTARYANQGTATWTTATSDGHYVELRACDQYGHATPSEFFVPTNPAKWIDATRVNTFDAVSEVPPIEEGTITFSIHMPPAASARSTNQYFGLFHRSDTEAMRMGVGGYDGMYETIKRFAPYDFDGDGVSDVWDRTADGRFLIDTATPSLNGWDSTYYGYGGPLDTPCPADYDGDGKCDIAVLRNADRKFLIDYAKNGFRGWDELNLGGYGGAGDIPCPGDYDGDGTDDIAVRDADGDYHIDFSTLGGFGAWDSTYYGYGGPLDTPCPADYDGDGKCDIAVLRNADRKFLIDYAQGRFGAWDVTNLGGYGGAGDIPCPGDFDGDGKADPAVLWTGDRTLRIDYSGDGLNSWNAILGGYGGVGDRVMVGLFDFDGRDDIGVYHPASNQVCFDMYAYAGVPAWGSWDYCDNTHATAAPLKMQPVTPEPEPVSLQFNCRVTPNPVQSGAVFQFDLPVRDEVTLSVFDLSGRLVTTVPTASYGPGRHTVSWTNAPKQPSGLYFVRLTSRLHTATVKFAVVP